MSNSLKFCIEAASDPQRSSYAGRDWSKAAELPFPTVSGFCSRFVDCINSLGLESDNLKEFTFVSQRRYEGNRIITNEVTLKYEDIEDYDYFTSSSWHSDGTMWLALEIDRIINSILSVTTYHAKKGLPKDGDRIVYTVGNFVNLAELDEKFVTEENPWMTCRETLLLPIKYEVFSKGEL